MYSPPRCLGSICQWDATSAWFFSRPPVTLTHLATYGARIGLSVWLADSRAAPAPTALPLSCHIVAQHISRTPGAGPQTSLGRLFLSSICPDPHLTVALRCPATQVGITLTGGTVLEPSACCPLATRPARLAQTRKRYTTEAFFFQPSFQPSARNWQDILYIPSWPPLRRKPGSIYCYLVFDDSHDLFSSLVGRRSYR